METKIGIGVMVFKDGKVLMARRKGSHGQGEYAFPGGHLEYMEGFEECARREVREECGIEIEDIEFLLIANVVKYAPKHYVHITLTAKWKNGEPVNREPEKSEAWAWYSLDELPEPAFEMCSLSVRSYKSKEIYFDKM
jgi:8-oxo-dGTP diphosphatase